MQNNVLFQTLLHVKQNTETIPKRLGIVLELFQSCFRLINIFIHMLKNMQIPKQFKRSQPITYDHTHTTMTSVMTPCQFVPLCSCKIAHGKFPDDQIELVIKL